jgi:glycosyltransferase involved in cell wall biosynthesis
MKVLFFNHRPLGGMGRSNTDLSYVSSLGQLQRHVSVEAIFPESRLSDIIETGRYFGRGMEGRLGLRPSTGVPLLAPIQERSLTALRRRLHWEVFYTNSRIPRGHQLGPVVMFDYIHEPAETDDPDAFARDVAVKAAVAERCAAVQVSTEAQRALFIRLGIAADRLHVVPFFMPDLRAAEPDTVRAKHAHGDCLHIAFVGHQARRKGLPALLEALREPTLLGLPLKLTIVSRFLDGDVPIPDDPRVTRHAVLPHAEVLKLFGEAHVVAVPSRRETFGLVYMEGMASGCVCVMAAGPQQRDISDDGRCGLPVGPDPQAIAQAIWQLHSDPEQRTTLALAGLKRFRTLYAPARVAARYNAMFRAARDRG